MTGLSKIFSQLKQGSKLTVCKIEDGQVYLPIPVQLFKVSGVNIDLPVSVAPLDIGGILIFNPSIHNPAVIKEIISSGLK